jgi:hypothetical protein
MRAKILDDAKGYVTQDRAATHGSAENNFGAIAAGWDWWMSIRQAGPLSPFDTACMMSIFKLARMASNPAHLDSAVDLCGYGAIAGELGQDYGSRPKVEEQVGDADLLLVAEHEGEVLKPAA